MLLKTVFIRFYKSFNFDYLRKYHATAEQQPWERMDDMWYPYVRIPIDPKVTTVVGANESGKSHLLTAIEKGISGERIQREDFCRYSQFFTVERGKMKWPDFGFEWGELSADDQQQVRKLLSVPDGTAFNTFLLFRTNRTSFTVFLPRGGDYSKHELDEKTSSNFKSILPRIFRLDPDIALPDSVSIRALAKGKVKSDSSKFEIIARQQRFGLFDRLDALSANRGWFTTPEAVTKAAAEISPAMSTLLREPEFINSDIDADKETREFNLAHDLICKVANVDPEALAELYQALRDGKEGHANGIIQEINDRLDASLNFPHWWVQDRNFRLVLSPREFDLVFTVRDRTDRDYSFNERSSGLKYFLSYYIQHRAHEPQKDRQEILLMDEPDAYLSSQAQQDLLKIFEAFAFPEDGSRPVQVIYVTHSPFLIDKNHAERIRVLEKGVGEEGTRVVKDAAKNHYEPLRSAFGAFVGETTFIGNCNLMVEGQADQILLAGAATHLRRKKVSILETLDLNAVTIVPCGSSTHIPYMVYLARGRDIEQPAVIALLDSDKSGNEARKRLRKGGAYGKQLLKDDFVLQLGDLNNDAGLSLAKTGAPIEIEDLIPLEICAMAARKYAKEVCGVGEKQAAEITAEKIEKKLSSGMPVFDAIVASFQDVADDLHIEKVGFARNVVDAVSELSQRSTPANPDKDLAAFELNMRALFRKLDRMRREAEREMVSERVGHKINRLKASFIQDYPTTARREQALVLFDDMLASLDEGPESEPVKLEIGRLRRDFEIDENLTQSIANYIFPTVR